MSQGCEVALTTLLRYKGEEPLGGVIGLSGLLGFDFENQIGSIKSMGQNTTLTDA
jgi:predicted esterase